jgi:predicted negative regulator of RcsB-dependent stress response
MLKPKKKITKKELKKDPFLEFINDAQNWLTEKKTIIFRIAIGVVVVIALIFFIGKNNTTNNLEADALLGKAFLSQDLGDSENAKFQFQSLTEDYASTDAGKQGFYYLGKMYFEGANFEDAEKSISQYVKKGKNAELLAASYRMLASIAVSNDDNQSAESYLQKAANNAQGTVFEYDFAILYAEQLNKNDNKSKALKIVSDILDDDEILYSTKKKAEELMGRIEG